MSNRECIHKGWVQIGQKKWDWCYLFNAKISDIHCEDCMYNRVVTATEETVLLPVV